MKSTAQALLAVKNFIRPIVSNLTINSLLMRVLKGLQPIIPDRLLVRVPVNGVAHCNLGTSKTLLMYSNADDPVVSGLMFQGIESYEPETIAVFKELTKTSKVILDVGANTGIYTLVAALENPNSKVYAFEPVASIYQRLLRNLELNGLNNVQPIAKVVSNIDGNATLYVPTGEMPTSSSMQKGHRQAKYQVEVPSTRLDTLVAEHNIACVDLIKIDTEKTEPSVLEGAINTIELHSPTIICEVLQDNIGKRLEAILEGLGYRYFWITDGGLIEKRSIEGDRLFKYLNYLFVSERNIVPIKEQLMSAGIQIRLL